MLKLLSVIYYSQLSDYTLRWYGYVIRKSDEYWVKKCMVYIIEEGLDNQEDMVGECRSGYGRT